MLTTAPTHPRVGVGILVWKGEALLLIRRGKPPGQGRWSIPGGSLDLGETLAEAARREVLEETGVSCRPLAVLTAVDSILRDPTGAVEFHYAIVEMMAVWEAGEPVADSDALEARWALPAEWRDLVDWPPLLAVLEQGWAAHQGAVVPAAE